MHAGEHYDEQGANLQNALRREFPIPVDGMMAPEPVKGAYWMPYPYWDWKAFHRVDSSEIVIYGIKDRALQERILARIRELKDERRVLVTFYDESRFTSHYDARGNGGSSRLPTPRLRRELLE